jgi:hypothetical protein
MSVALAVLAEVVLLVSVWLVVLVQLVRVMAARLEIVEERILVAVEVVLVPLAMV